MSALVLAAHIASSTTFAGVEGDATALLLSPPILLSTQETNQLEIVTLSLENTGSPPVGWSITEAALPSDGIASSAPCDSPGDLPWLAVSPSSGSLPGFTSADVTIFFDSIGLSLGTYHGNLCISTNEPGAPVIAVPVTLCVAEEVFADGFESGDTGAWSTTVP